MGARVTYRGTLGHLIRTRLQSNGVSAQKCSRRVLKHLVDHTEDLDIENAMFTILDQLVDQLDVHMPVDLRETLRKCAQERRRVCEELLHTDVATSHHPFPYVPALPDSHAAPAQDHGPARTGQDGEAAKRAGRRSVNAIDREAST